MKVSRFNVICKTPETVYAFNSYTGVLAKVNDDFFRIIDHLNSGKNESLLLTKEAELLANMGNVGFVVDDSIDEIKRIAEEQSEHRNSFNNIGFTIAPTLDCNFSCPYCFETARPGVMDENTQKATINFITRIVDEKLPKSISVVWYGGEPLLAKNVVFTMSKEIASMAKSRLIDLNFMIITNGYLLDADIADKLYECNIRKAQVTIDGCEERHNSRRRLKGDTEKETYTKILAGINFLAMKGIKVGIRMNIDKDNMRDIESFVRDMQNRITNIENITVNLGHVFDLQQNKMSYDDNCLSTECFADCKVAALKYCREFGLFSTVKNEYPRRRRNDCCATTMNSFVIRHDGKLYLCWSDLSIDTFNVGTVFESIDRNSEKAKKWNHYSALDNTKCISCNVLPVCMGGCPRERVYNGKNPDCTEIKYNIEQLIDFFAQEKELFGCK